MNVIFGSDGMIGRALARQMPDALRYNRSQVDICDYSQMFSLFSEHRPQVLFLAAANSNVDACEDVNTGKVNVAGTLLVLRLCEMFDTKLVWFSSSYVFNGLSRVPYEEQTPTDPVQNYGRQKEKVEQEILHGHTPNLIVRTVGVFGNEIGNKNFVKSVAASVTTRRKVFAPTDQYMNPIFSNDLANIVVGLSRHHTGIFHVAGDQCVSKYEYAVQVAKWFSKEHMVEGVTSDKVKRKVPRPRMACLDCGEIGLLGYSIPSFTVGLSQFLESEYGA